MTHVPQTGYTPSQLFWVGVIAAVAAILTGWLRTESIPATLLIAAASTAISVAIAWFYGRVRRAG